MFILVFSSILSLNILHVKVTAHSFKEYLLTWEISQAFPGSPFTFFPAFPPTCLYFDHRLSGEIKSSEMQTSSLSALAIGSESMGSGSYSFG